MRATIRAFRGRLRVGRILAALGVTLLVGTVAHQAGPYLAYRRLQDGDWFRAAPPSELRATAHRALAFVPGDPHDAFGVLERHGDASSIPYLRAALAGEDDAACTWNHGRRALDRALKLHQSRPLSQEQ